MENTFPDEKENNTTALLEKEISKLTDSLDSDVSSELKKKLEAIFYMFVMFFVNLINDFKADTDIKEVPEEDKEEQ